MYEAKYTGSILDPLLVDSAEEKLASGPRDDFL